MSFLFGNRRKTLSECSDDSVDGSGSGGGNSGSKPIPITRTSSLSSSGGSEGRQFGSAPTGTTAAEGGKAAASQYLYDVDGKFAYTYYEKKPELYDIDGKHRFKYFSHLKRLDSPLLIPGQFAKISEDEQKLKALVKNTKN